MERLRLMLLHLEKLGFWLQLETNGLVSNADGREALRADFQKLCAF